MRVCLLVFLLLIPVCFAEIYISEVQPQDNEFIEIYSDEELNLSGNILYDLNGKSKELELIKEFESDLYLIINKRENIEEINATIYISDGGNGLTSYGLNKKGEEIWIQVKNNKNLSFSYSNSNLKTGESYQYNPKTKEYIIAQQTPGTLYEEPKKEPETPESSENTKSETQPTCNTPFQIIPEETIFENKLEYNFETQEKDFIIEYWIEDYNGNVAKSKYETERKTQKSFTPSKSYGVEIFKIKAILHSNGCQIENQTLVTYYPKEKTNKKTISEIKITNKDELLAKETNRIEYEIYRGDTNKRVTHLKINGGTVSKLEIDKFSTLKGTYEIENLDQDIKILIEGLDEEDGLKLDWKTLESAFESQEIAQNKKPFMNITNINLTKSNLSFEIMGKNFSSQCYIYLKRTLVSEKLEITNSGIYSLKINNTKISEKSENASNTLKLTCKYKKSNHVSDYYESREFEHKTFSDSSNFISTQRNTSNNEILSTSLKINSPQLQEFSSQINQSLLTENLETNNSGSETIYVSKNQKLSLNSFFFIFVGSMILCGVLIMKR